MAGDALQQLAATDWAGTLAPPQCATLVAWAALRRPAAATPAPSAAAPGAAGRADPAAPAPAPERENLSAREAEVLAQIAEGASNKHIARTLALSPHTVKRHVANILDKLALATRGQAAAWYRAQGGTPPPNADKP